MTTTAILLALAAIAGAAEQRPAAGAEAAPELPRHEMILARHSDAARRDYDVWRMCGDGTQLASLVVEPGNQIQLAVSPDGTEFAYTSRRDGQAEIWRKPFGRGAAVNLTDHPADDSGPAWSPDGGRIAFFSDRDAEKPELYLLTLADGSVDRLTDDTFYDSGAAWSPDGTGIVFTRFFPAETGGRHAGVGEFFRLDLESREATQLTELGGYNGDPSFSPDGRTIAFHRAHGGGSEIWLMDADAANARPLTATRIDEYSPAWSPDGEWLAFSAGVGNDSLGTFDVWLMRPDGSHRRVLNAAPNTEAWQQWRPGEHHCR